MNGEHFAMETHFVHQSADGDLAVVGVLQKSGAVPNEALARIWSALPAIVDEQSMVAAFDVTAVLPRDRSMYRYAGSLTTPPCTEGVRWQVLQEPTPISEAQVAAFSSIITANARPVQPMKARDVLKDAIWKLITPA